MKTTACSGCIACAANSLSFFGTNSWGDLLRCGRHAPAISHLCGFSLCPPCPLWLICCQVPIRNSELEPPSLGYQVFSSPTLVRLLFDPLESGLLIQVPRRVEFALRPQKNLLVSSTSREVHALGNQSLADSQSSRARFNHQQSQLRHGL